MDSSTPCGDGTGMDCREIVTQLYTFLDGQLTDDRRAVIEQHLDDCSHCDDMVDFEAELRKVIAQKCREQVPDELRARVADALRRADAGS